MRGWAVSPSTKPAARLGGRSTNAGAREDDMRSGFRLVVAYGMLAFVVLGIFLKGFQDHGYWVAGGIGVALILAAVGVGNLIADRMFGTKKEQQAGTVRLLEQIVIVSKLGTMLQRGTQLGEALRRLQAEKAHDPVVLAQAVAKITGMDESKAQEFVLRETGTHPAESPVGKEPVREATPPG
jgi:hypothetical protein